MFPTLDPQPRIAEQEESVLAYWERESIFKKSVTKNEGKQPFVIYDGPPYANARPPLHTMVPMAFKDLAGRYKTMRGYHVPRQAGWDTHGLPIEVQIEKQLGLAGKQEILNLVPGDPAASIKKFNDICRQSVFEFKKEWDQYVPRVGYWTDLEDPYVTYEPQYIEKSWGVFKEIWDKDVVYKGYKVVPYCPRCGTPLSSHEVAQEYHDTKDVSVFVSFPITGKPKRAFLAWTTTPWTLPGNVGLAVRADMDYVVILQKDEQGAEKEYVLAKSRLEIIKGDYVIIEELKGSSLVGLTYEPLFPDVLAAAEGKKFVVLAADFVTDSDGSGIVHTAVMYGEDDFNLGKAEGLAMMHSVGPDGVFLPNTGEFAGVYIRDALGQLLTALQDKGKLYAKQSITHSYPFCWRCKTALIYYATDSWFIGMSKLRSELMRSNAEVRWIPDHIKEGRFGDFIKEARDWAVSRERFWGIPLPIWTSQSGKYICIGSFAELKQYAKDPSLITDDFDPHRPDVDTIILVKDREEYVREAGVLDIWFDSGAMPYASGREEQGLFPADYIAEATDQTRGWFYVLQAISTVIRGKSPFKTVVCMGLLLDEHGKKMSKSVGNILDPWETFKQTGVDAIRWFLYTVNAPGETKAFSVKEVLGSFRRSLMLLWNVANYFTTYANTEGVEPIAEGDRKVLRESLTYQGVALGVLDRWILSRQANVRNEVTAYLDDYDFLRAGRALESYIDELSTWYLRRSRKRTDPAFFAVLHDCQLNVVTMLAPMTPFITETLYQSLRHTEMPESVHLAEWPEELGSIDSQLESVMSAVRQAVELGLSVRAAAKIKVRQPLATAYLLVDDSVIREHFDEELLSIIAEELNVETVLIQKTEEDGLDWKREGGIAVALDTVLTDDLLQAGHARELLRHIQQLRKDRGLKPGQVVTLVVGVSQRYIVEPLFERFPAILSDSFVRIDPEVTWKQEGEYEISLGGEIVLIDFVQ